MPSEPTSERPRHGIERLDARAVADHASRSAMQPRPHGKRLENAAAAALVKGNELQQVVELLEMLLVEVVEKSARADGMPRDFDIVNVPVPVRADLVGRRHARDNIAQRVQWFGT